MAFPKYIILFDMFLCALFAIPVLGPFVVDTLNGINAALGLPGTAVMADGGAGFFVNFAGLLGVCFNIALLDPERRGLHRMNCVARLAVVGLILYYMAQHQLPAIFVLFIATELIGGALTLVWLRSSSARI